VHDAQLIYDRAHLGQLPEHGALFPLAVHIVGEDFGQFDAGLA
jgi:hypothetical protein